MENKLAKNLLRVKSNKKEKWSVPPLWQLQKKEKFAKRKAGDGSFVDTW